MQREVSPTVVCRAFDAYAHLSEVVGRVTTLVAVAGDPEEVVGFAQVDFCRSFRHREQVGFGIYPSRAEKN